MIANKSTLKKYKGKSSENSKRVFVNRILLKSRMLSKGIEFYRDLAQRIGVSRHSLYNLIEGRKWYPSLAEKVEEFLGVEKGRIFRRV